MTGKIQADTKLLITRLANLKSVSMRAGSRSLPIFSSLHWTESSMTSSSWNWLKTSRNSSLTKQSTLTNYSRVTSVELMEYDREHDDSKRKSRHSECSWKPVNRMLSSKVWPTLSRSCKDRLPPKVVNRSLKKKWKKVKCSDNPSQLPNNRSNSGLALMVSTVTLHSSLPCRAYSHLSRQPSNKSKRRSSSRSRRKKIL